MQDPHDEHPPCFKDEDTQELLVVHTAHGMASEPVDKTRGVFTQKWGGKGWSSNEVGIMQESLCMGAGDTWVRSEPKRSSKLFSCVSTFRGTTRLCLAE